MAQLVKEKMEDKSFVPIEKSSSSFLLPMIAQLVISTFVTGDGQQFFSNTTRYPYDFTLSELSPLINKANVTAAASFPFDYFGKNRLSDGLPDIGATEK